MTTRPKLHPHHRHEWEATLIDNEVRCLVCGWELSRPIAKYDDPTGSLIEDESERIPVHDSGVAT
jgi:hypothetical protein